MISRENYNEWRVHPISQWFFDELKACLQNRINDNGFGKNMDMGSVDATAMRSAKAVGYNRALKDVIDGTIVMHEIFNTRGDGE